MNFYNHVCSQNKRERGWGRKRMPVDVKLEQWWVKQRVLEGKRGMLVSDLPQGGEYWFKRTHPLSSNVTSVLIIAQRMMSLQKIFNTTLSILFFSQNYFLFANLLKFYRIDSSVSECLIKAGIQGDQEKGVTGQAKGLRASTPVNNHARDFAVDDLLFVIEVQHVDGGHLGGCAARPCWAPGIGLLYKMGVGIFLHKHILALAWTIVGFVSLGCDNPIPTEGLKVNCQRVAAATGLSWMLITI